jgi:RNA polymerase sigma-70 factor (sigma-E family)
VGVRGALLRRKAFLMTGDWHLADDLCQDVFVQMYSRWSKIARGGNVDAYANRVLAGKYVDSTRRPWRREKSTDTPPDQVDASASSGFDGVDQSDSPLTRALATLPPKQRAVVVLRFVDDLTVDEIARETGIASGTVKSRLSRGIDALRLALVDSSMTSPHALTPNTSHPDRSTQEVETLS